MTLGLMNWSEHWAMNFTSMKAATCSNDWDMKLGCYQRIRLDE